MNEQLHFILAITSGAIPTEFSVSRMRGREAISELFHFEVDIAEPELGWPEDIAPGGRAELRWVYEGQVKRTVYGMFAHVEKRVWGNGEKTAFRVHLVPRAHRLAMVKTQQIFMEMGLEDIARRKTKLLGLSDRDVGWNVLGEDPAREFIVQYQESDLDFIARHAEHRGIAYYFDHEDDYDRLVFTDHNGGFFTNEALPTVAMGENAEDHNQVYELRRDEKMIPRVYVVYDYNYRTPSVNIKAQETLNPSEGGGVVEYGVHAKTGGEAQALAKIRAEELSCRKAVYRGESGVVEIAAGLKTTMEAYDHGEALPLLIITVEHEFDLAAEGATGSYRNTFEALDSQLNYRPERTTPKPVIPGLVTAIVQGVEGDATGQEPWLDKYGRYVVQFHFDSALGMLNQKASRPVRRAQPFAGDSDGMHFPLRPGVEVAISFVGGDPDRPVIVGAIKHHQQRSVVNDEEATINRIQTQTGITIQFGRKC